MENNHPKETLPRQSEPLQRRTQKASFLEEPTALQATTQDSEKQKRLSLSPRTQYIIMALGLMMIPAIALGSDSYGHSQNDKVKY